jgi:hypothetical protein
VTNKDLTLIAALLDRTGSMETCVKPTCDGFDELINDQKHQPGRAIVTLAQFDRHGTEPIPEFVYRNKPINDVPKLQLIPRGMTPLLDATGEFITEIGQSLAELDEDKRPGLVICVIMTDGMENASYDWSWERISELIKQQRDDYAWQFMFIGANIDAVKVGRSMGLAANQAMTYNAGDAQAVMDSYQSVSNNVSAMRGMAAAGMPMAAAAANFTDEDRAKAMGEKKEPNLQERLAQHKKEKATSSTPK